MKASAGLSDLLIKADDTPLKGGEHLAVKPSAQVPPLLRVTNLQAFNPKLKLKNRD
jgi:hypothetical protein